MKRTLLSLAMLSIVLLTGCAKEDEDNIKLASPSEIRLHFGEERQINAESIAEITYESDNKYHSTVSKDGLITARFVGNNNIKLTNTTGSTDIRIIIEPKYDLYDTPCIKWGRSKEDIINAYSIYGEPDEVTEEAIAYIDYSNSADLLMFIFDEKDKLEATIVMVKTSYSSTLGSFLSERYLFLGEEENIIMLINALDTSDATTAIGAKLYNTSYWQVIYIPTAETRSDSDHIQAKADKMFKLLTK